MKSKGGYSFSSSKQIILFKLSNYFSSSKNILYSYFISSWWRCPPFTVGFCSTHLFMYVKLFDLGMYYFLQESSFRKPISSEIAVYLSAKYKKASSVSIVIEAPNGLYPWKFGSTKLHPYSSINILRTYTCPYLAAIKHTVYCFKVLCRKFALYSCSSRTDRTAQEDTALNNGVNPSWSEISIGCPAFKRTIALYGLSSSLICPLLLPSLPPYLPQTHLWRAVLPLTSFWIKSTPILTKY